MKNYINYLLCLIVLITLIGCQPTYYQIYDVKTPNNITTNSNTLIYEDANCKITYDLWANGGNFSFKFFNKTADNIYIHMDESFYTNNGIANNYFNNTIETNSKFASFLNSATISSSTTTSSNSTYTASRAVTGYNSFDLLQTNKLIKSNSYGITNNFGVSNTFQTTEGFGKSVTKIEERIIVIPRNSAKIIYAKKLINDSYLSFKDLKEYPNSKEKFSLSFNKDNTPLSFSNIISYSLNRNDKLIKVYNDFYISEIINYNGTDVIKSVTKDANGKMIRPFKYFTVAAPNKFYIKLENIYYRRSF